MANEIELKAPPLIPLEYCTPQRAAKLLGCEVDDLLHWSEIGAITLYVQFNESEFDYVPGLPVGGIDINEALYAAPSNDIGFNELNGDHIPTNKSSQSVPVVRTPNVLFNSSEFFKYKAGLSLLDPDEGMNDRHVALSGFWAVDSYTIAEMQVLAPPISDMGWMLRADYCGSEAIADWPHGILLVDVKKPDMFSRLRVMRKDLLRVQLHMMSGELMAPQQSKHDYQRQDALRHLAKSPRVTQNQSKAVVELLESLGYTTDDLKGSAEALQQKIARNGHSKQLHSVTAKTLRDWLDKGGAR